LHPFGQSGLIRFWDELNESQRQSLAQQIREIDFELIGSLFDSQDEANQWGELAARAVVPPAITLADFADPESYRKAYSIGGDAIAKNKVAMILVAGGQGSRLGFHHPKGMYSIGPLSGRSLYQVHIEHLMARAKQFGAKIPLYVMSSPPTHDETTEFLRANKNFGLAEEDLRVFCQGTMPAVNENGRLILKSKHELFLSPDGHGGTLAALVKSGCLQDMQDRGIQHVFYAQVDNPLVQVCHPALIGYHIENQSEMTSQVVRKTDPMQKVGNVVKVDDEVRIIEYSDLPEEYARQTNGAGTLKLWAGSIAVHVFETAFLDRCRDRPEALPYHRARKKVPYIDEQGNQVEPGEPNAIKFERFIFDLLPVARNAIVCEVDPAEGFCAVKNAAPAESETPEHVKQALIDLHTKWLKQAGAEVEPGTDVEINPLFAVDCEQLGEKISAGTRVAGPTYFV
jgi:UDP-N-acetylglucosamine/UDP-N-acetylgalactosamine diphosphorylase